MKTIAKVVVVLAALAMAGLLNVSQAQASCGSCRSKCNSCSQRVDNACKSSCNKCENKCEKKCGCKTQCKSSCNTCGKCEKKCGCAKPKCNTCNKCENKCNKCENKCNKCNKCENKCNTCCEKEVEKPAPAPSWTFVPWKMKEWGPLPTFEKEHHDFDSFPRVHEETPMVVEGRG